MITCLIEVHLKNAVIYIIKGGNIVKMKNDEFYRTQKKKDASILKRLFVVLLSYIIFNTVIIYCYEAGIVMPISRREYGIVFILLTIVITSICMFVTVKVVDRNDKRRKEYLENLRKVNQALRDVNQKLEMALKEKENAIKEKDAALDSLNNFRLTYDKIRNDFATRTSNSKNYLQKVVSTYDKQAWDVQEKEAVKLGRHDVFGAFNKFREWKKEQFLEKINKEILVDKDSYKNSVKEYFMLLQTIGQEYNENLIADTYDIVLSPWLKVMQNDLKELEHVLDITPETKTVKQVLDAMVAGKAIPKNLAENKLMETKRFEMVVTVPETVQNKGICTNLVLSKLQSILFNLIENSARAIDEHCDKLEGEEKYTYEGMIELRISETIHTFENSNTTCNALCFEVQDNAGGFPERYLKDIYKRPVPSSKKEDRPFGEGSVYVGFFVDLMKGDIEAQNADFESYGYGALTKVFIPYFEMEA